MASTSRHSLHHITVVLVDADAEQIMMNHHTALGIAQIVFYVLAVPLAIWLMARNGKQHPRMAWYPFIPFTLSE